MVFCNFLEIKAETKKMVGVKVDPFRVLYSCVKFRRLKMGDRVYRRLVTLKLKLKFTYELGHAFFYPIYTNKMFLTRGFINLAVNYVIFRFFSCVFKNLP